MKITEAQGEACIKHMEQLTSLAVEWDWGVSDGAWEALGQLVGLADAFREDFSSEEHYLTALAMCAAIAGVRP